MESQKIRKSHQVSREKYQEAAPQQAIIQRFD
jgi:hypothetical protein